MKITTVNYIYAWDRFIVTCYYPNGDKVIHYGYENYERNLDDQCEVGIWRLKKKTNI